MPDPVINVQELRKTYRDGLLGRRRVEALKGVSFRVERGTIFGLLGPNGAGKTTLIKVLLGIVRKTGGSAELLGMAAGDRRGRRRVGYLPESHRIPRYHSANSALEYYGSLSGMSGRDIRRRRPEMLELVGLSDQGKSPVKSFSKGMLQRLGLAQALMHDPELLVLDEPINGVNPVGRSEMRSALQRLKSEGKTIFINSHLLQEIELVCDRVVILVQGKVRREGPIDEITRRDETEIELTVRGSEEAIREALGLQQIVSLKPLLGNRFRLVLQIPDQAAVDQSIDGLRTSGISIEELVRRRDTLEEAFLDIVSHSS